MNELQRVRLSLLVKGLATGSAALAAVILNAGSPVVTGVYAACCLALLAAFGWFSTVAIISVVAQPHDEMIADLPALPGYTFVLFILAHLTTALRRSMDDREGLYRRLTHQARHDNLTGLPNRTVLEERLDALRAGDEPYALMMVDLDRFKHVNDTFGHAVGDQLLQVIAGRLDECLRGPDLVVRFGGDEFVVLVERCPEPAVAEELACRIEAAIRRPVTIDDLVLEIGASVGVAFDEPTPERALSAADAAMYAAKSREPWRREDASAVAGWN
jgi:diguanylate cyclase (GGDEF)-like protein